MLDLVWKNQIVWSKWSRKYVPAIVIDPNDDFEDLQPAKPGYHHVFWLGDKRISLVNQDSVFDFCEYFNEFYPKLGNKVDASVGQSVKILVKLFGARAFGKRFEENEDWEKWAKENIGHFKTLNVTDSFFKVLFPTQKDTTTEAERDSDILGVGKFTKGRLTSALKSQIESATRGFSNATSLPNSDTGTVDSDAGFQKGQLVWSKGVEMTRRWPAVVLDRKLWYPGGVAVVIVTGSGPGIEENIVQSMPHELHDFCYEFDSNFKENSKMRYSMAVRRCVAWVQKATGETQSGDKDWKTWATGNISRYTGVVLRNWDLEQFLSHIHGGKKKKHQQYPGKVKKETKKLGKTHKENTRQVLRVKVAKKVREIRVARPGLQSKKVPMFDDNKDFSQEAKQMLSVPLDRGWRREMCYRKPPSCKLGDIYYFAPPLPGSNKERGKKLRSRVEVVAYLHKNGINDLVEDNFSFYEGLIGHPTNESSRHALPGHWPVVREKGGKVRFIETENV